MKFKELKERATCCVCHKKLGKTQHPIFYVVEIRRYMLDGAAIQRQVGLEMMLGPCASIAPHIGPDEDLAKKIDTAVVTVCQSCSMMAYPLALLGEQGLSKQEVEDEC